MPALGAAIPALIGTVYSSLTGRNAAKEASTAQANALDRAKQISDAAVASGQSGVNAATDNANDILSNSAQQQLAMYSPYADAGSGSLKSLMALSGEGGPLDKQFSFTQKDLETDPGYEYTLAEGKKAIEHAAAAEGGLFSGSTLKSLAGAATGMASTHFNDAFQRAASTFDINRSSALSRIGTLQGLAGLGYGATTAGAGAVDRTMGQQSGNVFRAGTVNADLGMQGARIGAGLTDSQGNARAAGIMGSANATAGGIAGVTNSVSRGVADWLAKRKMGNLPGSTGTPNYSYNPNTGMQGG